MVDNLIKFYPKDAADYPDNVLEQAVGCYESVLIIGWDVDGFLDIRSSTNLNTSDILYLVDKFKHKLLNGDYVTED